MKRDFNTLTQDTFDLIVIGGGIIGTGIARDASLRGLHTLLVEKEDFAFGTTSSSSRLIHGGLRYLRMLEFKLVRQDLMERETLLNIAPHLVRKLEFVIPLLRSEPLYRVALPFGLRLYDFLAKGKTLPSCKHLSRKETLKLEPSLSETEGLVGSYLYYDCQVDFMERLCLENAIDAAMHNACILNHAAMTELVIENGVVSGIKVKDMISGKEYMAKGRLVLNAGGPWADLVWDKLNIQQSYSLRKTKGIHLLTSKLTNSALVLFAKSDGRLFFVIPWQDCTLIGTTDTDYNDDLDVPYADSSDTDYLVTELQNYFPGFKLNDIYFTMSGLRPLLAASGKSASNTSRAHLLVDHEQKDGVKGFISIIGGKITASRAVAEEAVDKVCEKLRHSIPCSTSNTPLPGAPAISTQVVKQAEQSSGLSAETINHLVSIYGSRFSSVLDCVNVDKRLGQPISPGCKDILAQIKYAIDEEEALTVNDYLLRRTDTGLRPSQGTDVAEAVAGEMGLILGWSSQEKQKQIDSYKTSIALTHQFRG